ncbi:MAG: hypothetical protein IT267_05580 [Saprospiraceae bacterium]|nr:hypothetical protein [Saprospiraceae bacterium]
MITQIFSIFTAILIFSCGVFQPINSINSTKKIQSFVLLIEEEIKEDSPKIFSEYIYTQSFRFKVLKPKYLPTISWIQSNYIHPSTIEEPTPPPESLI